MNKGELISAFANRSGITKMDARDLINDFLEIIAETLEGGESVEITQFGSFNLYDVPTKSGVCYLQGEPKPWTSPAHVSVRFKPSSVLKKRVY